MIRVVCYSEDRKLQQVLGPALGADYHFRVESDKTLVQRVVADGRVDVLILDFDSNYGALEDGLQLFNAVVDSGIAVVVMTDDARRSATLNLIQRGAYDFFRKPPSLVELRVVLGRAHERVVLRRELEKTRRELQESCSCDRLIGSSRPAQAVHALIRRVTNLNAPVMIRGESGTGKELIARAIHNLGNRAKHPFVAVPCGAFPETLIEAELFGHEKGAFTGTAGARVGYMEQAGEGTLLLDEIGELSPQTQVKLLRVLQERQFSRLGSCKLIPLRARVLAATHRSLEQMVEAGAFRVDLLFRLNVMTIEAPPLRERVDDIPALAQHFLEQSSAAFEKPVHEITPGAMDLLLAHQWPGNVRELENAIQSAIIVTQNDVIGPEDLPRGLQQCVPLPAAREEGVLSFEDQLWEYKFELATRALALCNGNKTLAARKLSISRAYLHRLIRPSRVQLGAA
jgi:DNA-binding NtrC family response regulator